MEMERGGTEITFLSWNVLAEIYFNYFPPEHLRKEKIYIKWKDRRARIIQILKEVNCDVYCLQEVDEELSNAKIYEEEFVGFKSHFKLKGGVKSDGCAIIYNAQKLNVKQIVNVELNDLTGFGFAKDVFTRYNVAQIALMELVECKSQFLLCNTHLYWDPKVTDVKIFQFWYVMKKIEEWRKTWKVERVVFCGDFNSMPTSAVVELATSAKLSQKNPDYDSFIRGKYDKFLSEHDGIISVPFPLKSAFSDREYFSNYTFDFRSTIDYIFFEGFEMLEKKVVEEKYKYIEDEDFRTRKTTEHKYPLCPNVSWPSDHLALKCKLRIN